jgi:hypothetical protein
MPGASKRRHGGSASHQWTLTDSEGRLLRTIANHSSVTPSPAPRRLQPPARSVGAAAGAGRSGDQARRPIRWRAHPTCAKESAECVTQSSDETARRRRSRRARLDMTLSPLLLGGRRTSVARLSRGASSGEDTFGR